MEPAEGHQRRQDDSRWPENSGVCVVTAQGVTAVVRTGIQTQDFNQYTSLPFLMQPQNPVSQGIMRKQVGALFPKGLGMLGWKRQVTYDRHD